MEGMNLVNYTDIPGSELHYGLMDGKDEEVLYPVSGSTRDPRLVNKFRSGSPSYTRLPQMKTLAGIHLMSQSSKKTVGGNAPFLAPVDGQSLSHVKLARGVSAPEFRFGGSSPQQMEVSLDLEIERREMNLKAEQEKIEELKQKKAAAAAQRVAAAEKYAALTAVRRETQLMMKMMVEQQMFEKEKMKFEKQMMLEQTMEARRRTIARNVKDRLGPKEVPARAGSSLYKENWARSQGRTGTKRKAGQGKIQNKRNNNQRNRLPDDLVLTTITEEGPKKARTRIVFDTDLPSDLILTELTEEGPRPKVFKPVTRVKSRFLIGGIDIINNNEDDDRVVFEDENDE